MQSSTLCIAHDDQQRFKRHIFVLPFTYIQRGSKQATIWGGLARDTNMLCADHSLRTQKQTALRADGRWYYCTSFQTALYSQRTTVTEALSKNSNPLKSNIQGWDSYPAMNSTFFRIDRMAYVNFWYVRFGWIVFLSLSLWLFRYCTICRNNKETSLTNN